ncbi:uncharacterized protein MELLADRAFT_72794 [Melampsora larici-populina 98AG31]|uniref:Zn(2)-C6 fungal-type domain-containing protein n=1 Tax=Melampsora larici-populina (strain 98AG31 / pathotype 3-4-7) TaxID=747676 RepID=F4RYZ5_MELLP|nr:uncharacterized protein MELLADRAFT_72794 [Melampsora larici-populina 98AG31]EGG02333.1 hypothetical protein MELLADRAFT_72794 [Melampsora larici-populina 98AG31]
MDLTGAHCPESFTPVEGSSASSKREVKGARRVRNACLQCRERKIRCSRTYPCKGCVSRGDGEACDWQGGFPSGDIPVQQQRVATQRREFDQIYGRIIEIKSLMTSLMRQDPSLKNRIAEWTQYHPELNDMWQDLLYPNPFSQAQQHTSCPIGSELLEWAFPSLYPPDSAASFESCASSATTSSTFYSLGNAGSSSPHSPRTAGSFLTESEATSPVPFLKPCKTSGYKSWQYLREAPFPYQPIRPSEKFYNEPRSQHNAPAHHPSHDFSQFQFSPQFYSPTYLRPPRFELVKESFKVGDAGIVDGLQSMANVHSEPSTSNPFSTTMPNQRQSLDVAGYFQGDPSFYGSRPTHRSLELTSAPQDNTLTPRNVNWPAHDNQSSNPATMGMELDIGKLSFGQDCGTGAENFRIRE